MKKEYIYYRGFTLVELIVVITILAILATVAFVSFTGYSVVARETTRINDIRVIEKKLNFYRTKHGIYPTSENNLTITGSGNILGYQSDIDKNFLVQLGQGDSIVDPLSGDFYTIHINAKRSKYQILAYMEEPNITQSYFSNNTYAAGSFPRNFGDRTGILANESGDTVLHKLQTGSLDLYSYPNPLTIIMTDDYSVTGTGYALYARAAIKSGGDAPTDCPSGFIGVPGNAEFNTAGFCVSQYEMTYADADVPNTCGAVEHPDTCITPSPRNTVRYENGKEVISMPGKYPIAVFRITEAVAACKTLGDKFHLMTNNEWMSVARNIESSPQNWSSGNLGEGFIHNGVSNSVTLGCIGNTGGNIEPRANVTRTGPGTDTSCNEKRQKTLATGGIMWDMSGNLFELVDKGNDYTGKNVVTGHLSVSGDHAGTGNWDADGMYSIDEMKKYGSMYGYGKLNGMGGINYYAGRENNHLVRGAYANNGDEAGLYTMLLGTSGIGHKYSANIQGFRCAREF